LIGNAPKKEELPAQKVMNNFGFEKDSKKSEEDKKDKIDNKNQSNKFSFASKGINLVIKFRLYKI